MIKFLLACLAVACTLLGLGVFGFVVWIIAIGLEAFFALFPLIGTGLAIIMFFGFIGWTLWLGCKVVWIFASSIYESLCEKYTK